MAGKTPIDLFLLTSNRLYNRGILKDENFDHIKRISLEYPPEEVLEEIERIEINPTLKKIIVEACKEKLSLREN